jgi:hypothetical protein
MSKSDNRIIGDYPMTASKLPVIGRILTYVKLYKNIYELVEFVHLENYKKASDDEMRAFNSVWGVEEDLIEKKDFITEFAFKAHKKNVDVEQLVKEAEKLEYLLVRDYDGKEVLSTHTKKGIHIRQWTKHFRYGLWLEVLKHLSLPLQIFLGGLVSGLVLFLVQYIMGVYG